MEALLVGFVLGIIASFGVLAVRYQNRNGSTNGFLRFIFKGETRSDN